MDDRVRRNVLVVIGVGLVALALGLALAWVLAGSLARPLRALARTARRVEDGELDARADITGASEQREVAIAFNDMTERLEESIQAQREFVGNASHQLRTPLTGLRLRLEAAGIKADDPAVEHELRLAEAEVERLTNLLNSLLTLARGGDRPVVRGPVSLRAVSEAAHERWLPRAEATGHMLALDGEGDAPVRAGEEDVVDRARQPDRERARLRAARNHCDDLLEPGRKRRRPRRRPRSHTGRRTAGLRALPPGAQRPAWYGAGARDRRNARPALGRHRVDPEPRDRRRPRRGAAARRPFGPQPGAGQLMRTAALGLLGLVLAVAVGYGVHLITRDTISLPVVQLQQPAQLAPPAATSTARTTTAETETETETGGTTTEDRGTETEDNSGSGSSGRGRGRGRGGGGDDD